MEHKFCRICGSSNLKKYIDFGLMPLANNLKEWSCLDPEKYPLAVLLCLDCSLSQLSYVVDPKVMYLDYQYHSSVSKTFYDHCSGIARDVKDYLKKNFKPSEYESICSKTNATVSDKVSYSVIDISSNDGCLMEAFRENGFGCVMGVEPSCNLVDEYEKKTLEKRGMSSGVVNDFWRGNAALRLPCVDAITATNVLGHVDDLVSFIMLVKKKLKRNGVFIIEVPYLVRMIEGVQFDTIYHEHLSYFLLKPLNTLFNSQGMKIVKVDENRIHGGSIRIFASEMESDIKEAENLRDLMDEEERLGFYRIETYQQFDTQSRLLMGDITALLKDLSKKGKRVAGYGAAAKASVILNACSIGSDLVDYIVDDTPAKQGKYFDGVNIPIVPSSELVKAPPDYLIIFPWNFQNEIMKKTEHLGFSYIVTSPEVVIKKAGALV